MRFARASTMEQWIKSLSADFPPQAMVPYQTRLKLDHDASMVCRTFWPRTDSGVWIWGNLFSWCVCGGRGEGSEGICFHGECVCVCVLGCVLSKISISSKCAFFVVCPHKFAFLMPFPRGVASSAVIGVPSEGSLHKARIRREYRYACFVIARNICLSYSAFSGFSPSKSSSKLKWCVS